MGDRYANFTRTGAGRALARRLGLPQPPRLHRHRPGDPLVPGPVLLGQAPGGRAGEGVAEVLTAAAVDLDEPDQGPPPDRPRLYAGLVFDATGIGDLAGLDALYDFFHPYLSSLYPNGRVLLLGTPPEAAGGARAAAAQRGLEGFLRSLAKEL